jgi:hypothetical protein
LKKNQNLNFWWYFKVRQANCFWADFDKIWQFWTDSGTMAVADSMPSFERKKRECHKFCKRCQNLASDGLLESPLNFPSTRKVSKNPITN